MSKPPIWKMIKEAIDVLGTELKYSDIKKYIDGKWEGEKSNSITAQIIALTVNHNSRIYYPENSKSRITDCDHRYDVLFSIRRGVVEKYSPAKHGIWEVFENSNQKLSVRLIEEAKETTKIFSPSDIIWIKNVTNADTGEAYLNLNGNTFVLNFPTKHRKNISSPQIGDIILLRQKINGVSAFTHLVSPIDEGEFDEDIRSNYRFGRRVKVIAKTSKDNFIHVANTSWKNIRLGGVSGGNACEIGNMKNVNEIEKLQLDIWQRFKPYFTEKERVSLINVDAALWDIENSIPSLETTEGRLRLVTHMIRERDAGIVKTKKELAIFNDALICEVCDFSFPQAYGIDFIECHHRTPISETGLTQTKLEDLALVCPNCHRMLHMKFEKKYLAIDELRDRILLIRNIKKFKD